MTVFALSHQRRILVLFWGLASRSIASAAVRWSANMSLSSSSGRSETSKMETSTVLVKNLPPTVRACDLQELFNFYGPNSCRLIAGTGAGSSLAFVCFSNSHEAQSAILALDGTQTPFGILQILPVPSMSEYGMEGQEPGASDNLYVLHIPAHWTETELVELFSPFGAVRQCRIFQVLNRSNCGSALVRMNNLAAARQAIQALNGRYPVRRAGESALMPLVVRYADSPEEKARKKARKEMLASLQQRVLLESTTFPGYHLPQEGQDGAYTQELLQQALGQLKLSGSPQVSSAGFVTEPLATALPSGILEPLGPLGVAPQSSVQYASSPIHGSSQSIWNPRTSLEQLLPLSPSTTKPLHPAPGPGMHRLSQSHPALPDSPTVIYISNAPEDADNLWFYKRFAPHGPILEVDMHGTAYGQGGRVCSVTYMNPQSAFNALQSVTMNNKDQLHISLEQPR